VRLGYFTMPLHPPGRPYPETLREDREAILLLDELGYAEAFVGEHVTDLAESITDCSVFLASLAHLTKRITLGTGTVNLPNGHPAAIAAKIAMLDHLLDGRFVFGISPGGLPSDWEVFGNLELDRREKFRECIDQILAIWAGEPPYNIEGKYWTISTERTQIPEIGQGAIVKPLQQPHPPIVVTVVEPGSSSAADAGARGWGIISANFLLPQWVRTHWERFVEGAGEGADPAGWRVAKASSPRSWGAGISWKATPCAPGSATTTCSACRFTPSASKEWSRAPSSGGTSCAGFRSPCASAPAAGRMGRRSARG